MIEELASRHGCIIGICDAMPLKNERLHQKRTTPSLYLPGAKSVIVFGKGHDPSPYGNLSVLGHGMDYHIILRNILEKTANKLGCGHVIMVDDGPLAEREFAVKAGLGFLGKNGMVISPILGSFFNIGILIVDIEIAPTGPYIEIAPTGPYIEIAPTGPYKGSCPTNCRICQESCPNDVIGSADQKRCISYITQKKGQLTEEEEALMSGQLYGCDLCQICCPFNQLTENKIIETAIIETAIVETAISGRENAEIIGRESAGPGVILDSAEILEMDEDNFNTRFGHTAMAWRGLKHLQRNACIYAKYHTNPLLNKD